MSGGLTTPGTTRSLYAPVSSPSRPSQQNASVQYFLTSPVCQRLFQPTKPYAATSMHHSVDNLITHGNVDQAAPRTSVRTPAFLQLIYGAGPSSADTQRRYGPGWLRNYDDDDDGWTFTSIYRLWRSESCLVHIPVIFLIHFLSNININLRRKLFTILTHSNGELVEPAVAARRQCNWLASMCILHDHEPRSS